MKQKAALKDKKRRTQINGKFNDINSTVKVIPVTGREGP
jgi:hypothetical protein